MSPNKTFKLSIILKKKIIKNEKILKLLNINLKASAVLVIAYITYELLSAMRIMCKSKEISGNQKKCALIVKNHL